MDWKGIFSHTREGDLRKIQNEHVLQLIRHDHGYVNNDFDNGFGRLELDIGLRYFFCLSSVIDFKLMLIDKSRNLSLIHI